MVFRCSKGHIGGYLAAYISECLHDYGIQGKVNILFPCIACNASNLTLCLQILAITTDNVSNNNTLIDELGDLFDGFQGSLTHV